MQKKASKKLVIKIILLAVVIAVIYLVVSTILVSMGIKDSRFIALGKKNATNYLMEKYGIEAEIVSAKRHREYTANADYIPTFSGNYTDNVDLTIKYKDREFRVLISGIEKTSKGYDNYQSEEIYDAVIDRIKSHFPANVQEIRTDIREGALWSDYYTGNNLDAFISPDSPDNPHYFIVSTVGCDVESLDLDKIASDVNAQELIVYDYRSENDFNKAVKLEINDPEDIHIKPGVEITLGREFLNVRLPFLDEYAKILNSTDHGVLRDYVKNRLKECDGILYGSFDDDNVIMEPVDYTFDEDNYGKYEKDKKHIGSYSISSTENTEQLYIYVPTDKMMSESGGISNPSILVTYKDENSENQYSTENVFDHSSSHEEYPYCQGSLHLGKYQDGEFTPYKDIIWTMAYK